MVNGGIVGATWVSPNSGHIRLLVTSAFASTTARGFSGFFVWTQQSSDIIFKKQKSKEGTYRSTINFVSPEWLVRALDSKSTASKQSRPYAEILHGSQSHFQDAKFKIFHSVSLCFPH